MNKNSPDQSEDRIAIIGLGYVGLPLATAFGAKFDTVGYDINATRIDELAQGIDRTLEVSKAELAAATRLQFAADEQALTQCNIFIVTVPTPIDENKQPDLQPLLGACRLIGAHLAPGDLVIFESTVYPGATELTCAPLLEKCSGLSLNQDFFVGYSPERINPGDPNRRITDIVKLTSGSTPAAGQFVDSLYSTIIEAGTCPVSRIQVAEAAKVIENTQRDLNIALINELSMIFHKMDIDTSEVLDAAATKWNFQLFRPGLVGGHCIGVDPYYLTYRAHQVGHHPEIILSGRRINDSMGSYVAGRVIKLMTRRKIPVADSRILILGLTFKENCPDLRNSRVVDIIRELVSYGITVDLHDPWVSDEGLQDATLNLFHKPPKATYDAIILAVAHDKFRELGAAKIRQFGREPHVLFDLKSMFEKHESDGRL